MVFVFVCIASVDVPAESCVNSATLLYFPFCQIYSVFFGFSTAVKTCPDELHLRQLEVTSGV